jgi:hypothetical protein
MKAFKRLIIWVMISLIIQMGGFFYLNNYLLASNTTVKSTKVVNSQNKKADAEVRIPDNATNINVSYNAKYVAYYANEILYVVNNQTGKMDSVSFTDGAKVSFYKWLPDRNRMLIAEKDNGKLSLSYYDVDKSQKDSISEITMADSKSEVVDIEAAPLPNVIYIKVSTGGERNNIYWLNIMKDKKKIATNCYIIGDIKVVPHADKMVYEDLTYNKVYVTGMDSALTFKDSKKTCLVGIDNDDQVYIGNVNSNGKVNQIYYGTLKQSTSSWQTINLNTPLNKSDLFVAASGKIYINDNLKGTVTELQTGKVTYYKGIFLELYNNGIATTSDGILMKTVFN